MTARSNTAAGAPLLTELTAANTGGGSGDQFSSVTRTGSPSFTAVDINGKRWYALSFTNTTDQITINWNEGTPPAVGSFRAHCIFDSVTANTFGAQIIHFFNTAGSIARLAVKNDGTLQVWDASNTATYNSPAGTIPIDSTELVIEAAVDPGTDASTGKMLIRVWTGAGLTTKALDVELTGKNFFRSGGITSRRWGKVNGGHTPVFYMRQIAVADSYALLGPAVETPPVVIPSGPYDLILLTGASNMRGAATDYDATGLDKYMDNVYQWNASGGAVGTVTPAVEPLMHGDNTYGMGPAQTFTRDYITAGRNNGRPVMLVPMARRGTGFTQPDSNGANLSWRADLADSTDKLIKVASDMYDAVMAAYPGSQVKAILHNFGTTDSSANMVPATWTPYAQAMLDAFRAKFGATVPFIMMQSRPDLMAAETRHGLIDQAARDLLTVKPYTGYAYSPNGSQYFEADAVHFNAAGQRVIGHNLYAQLDAAAANSLSGGGSKVQETLAWFKSMLPGKPSYFTLADYRFSFFKANSGASDPNGTVSDHERAYYAAQTSQSRSVTKTLADLRSEYKKL